MAARAGHTSYWCSVVTKAIKCSILSYGHGTDGQIATLPIPTSFNVTLTIHIGQGHNNGQMICLIQRRLPRVPSMNAFFVKLIFLGKMPLLFDLHLRQHLVSK